MKADEVLVEHHRVLLGLLDRLERTPDPGLRRQLLDAFVVELTIHTQIEDELLYPAVRDVSPLLSVAHAEHRQIDEQLAVVLGTEADSDELAVEVRMLTRTLAHHVDEEELGMLPQAQALGEARLEELGRQLRERQSELDRSGAAHALARVKRSVLRRV